MIKEKCGDRMVLVIVGPTGVGKTKLSIALAKKFHGEIINADSMQVYRGLDIGTAKVTEEEKENIPHHLFDICDVTENYTSYQYQKDARQKMDEILAKGKTPILVGGTGYYIKSALYNYEFQEEEKTPQEPVDIEEAYQRLLVIDPNTKIHKNNQKRVLRAIQAYEQTGKIIGSAKSDELLYDAIFIGLTTERANLYERINQRVDQMIEQGLVKEVESFYKDNIHSKALMTGIGYKELYAFFDQTCTLEQAISKMKQNSRRYAKRQYTFFRHQFPTITWFSVNYDDFEKTMEEVISYLQK